MSETSVNAYNAVADVYDEWTGSLPDTPATVDFLAKHAGGGAVLELGVGTGRVALPLAARGIDVAGVEGAEGMIAKLRLRPGGASFPVVCGNMADVPVDGTFSMIYAVFNTFLCLLSQEEQVRCLRNVVDHLEPDGTVVLEMYVPDVRRTDADGQRLATGSVERNRVFLEATMHDSLRQRIRTQVVVLSETGIRLYPSQIRYVWPSELDLMAQLAGLRLVERHSGWNGEPFTGQSTRHVSVFRRA
ncbi:class I SAM-dependent DNA methyltransferase [Wenjunlia tyrosinilytica]|uniref:Methyltransferase n=1 Tax=Wenjunlia tyrosinilytica TaxID=1544741 RepID=A0A918DZ44_9ACTN|nr:class I SAM-dependent methyltransferase [Wenjunlia tyrosinilytica]GGO94231.1 methyltransferase [Wenjunlia tyrosinilytica]